MKEMKTKEIECLKCGYVSRIAKHIPIKFACCPVCKSLNIRIYRPKKQDRSMKRVWKSLDINGLRLYKVKQVFSGHPEWDQELIVAAKSPTQARKLVEDAYAGSIWFVEPSYWAGQLKVYQPEEWRDEL